MQPVPVLPDLSAVSADTSILNQLAATLQSMATPACLAILGTLSGGERAVQDIARRAGHSVPNTSQHLARLHKHEVVRRRRAGTQVFYRLADERLPDILRLAARIGA